MVYWDDVWMVDQGEHFPCAPCPVRSWGAHRKCCLSPLSAPGIPKLQCSIWKIPSFASHDLCRVRFKGLVFFGNRTLMNHGFGIVIVRCL